MLVCCGQPDSCYYIITISETDVTAPAYISDFTALQGDKAQQLAKVVVLSFVTTGQSAGNNVITNILFIDQQAQNICRATYDNPTCEEGANLGPPDIFVYCF